MKKIYKKEEGVSPVIATILMVAITVVLAATVWLLVSGYMGGSTQTPLTMSLTYNAQESSNENATFDVTLSHPSQANPSNVKVTVKDSSGTTYSATGIGEGYSNAKKLGSSSSYKVYYVDLNGNGKLDTGDQIIIHTDDTTDAPLGGLTVYVYVSGYSGNTHATVPS